MTEVMALVDKNFKTTTVNIPLHSYKGTHIYKGMHICQNSLNCTLRMDAFLYVHYSSNKLIFLNVMNIFNFYTNNIINFTYLMSSAWINTCSLLKEVFLIENDIQMKLLFTSIIYM